MQTEDITTIQKGNGRFKTYLGYILVKSPDHPFKNSIGYVLEHRLVMEKKIGRFLTAKEQVHHVNGIKDDNRIENLILCKDRKDHAFYHRTYCKICGEKAHSLKLCFKHYQEHYAMVRPRTPCVKCGEKTGGNNRSYLCRKCWYEKVKSKTICAICGEKAVAKTLCRNHYAIWRRRGFPIKNENPDYEIIEILLPGGKGSIKWQSRYD